jgi:hypothetical protein
VRRLWPTAWSNPVFQLELRRLRRSRWWPNKWFYVVCLGLCPLLFAGLGVCGLVAGLAEKLEVQIAAAVAGLVPVFMVGIAAWLLSWILPWAAPALAAPAIARERELGTLDLLRGTLLSERSIVLGKLGACLMQLWPGVFLLILMTPFHIVKLAWGTFCLCPSGDTTFLLAFYEMGTGAVVAGITLTMLVGTLRPLADLVFHAAVGLLVSSLAHSTSVAVAVSYGAVLAIRAFTYLVTSVLIPVLALAVLGPMVDGIFDPSRAEHLVTDAWMYGLLLPSLVPILIALLELVGAVLLVWLTAKRLSYG